MNTIESLERRKHELRCQMVKFRAENNPAQMCKVYNKLMEVKRAQAYLRRT